MSRFGQRTRVSSYLSDWMPTGDAAIPITVDYLVVAGGGGGGRETFSTGNGGGGGCGDTSGGNGGSGGGGAGAKAGYPPTEGISGTVNTGGGGGGTYNGSATSPSGGSGVVILRYADTFTITIGAGLTGSESAASGGYKRATITAGTGNVSWA